MKNILRLIATVSSILTVFSCNKEIDKPIDQPSEPETYTLSISASKMELTKGLELSGDALNAIWDGSESVYVFKNDTQVGVLTPDLSTLVNPEKVSCTLTGPFTTVPDAGDVLTLKLTSNNYSGQDGTLVFIAGHCDYAVATLHVTGVNNGQIESTEGTAAFENQQAIVKFTLKDKADGTTLLTPTTLTVNDGTSDIATATIPAATYTTNGSGVLYVAIPPVAGKTLTLTATIGEDTYSYTRFPVTFAQGQYYTISVKMIKQRLVDLSTKTGDYEAQDGDVLTGTLGSGYALTIPHGATVITLAGMTHHAGENISGIECLGSATIILAPGTVNDLTRGDNSAFFGIAMGLNNGITLTIEGSGTLNASGGGSYAGIGGGSQNNLVINGGNITATGGDFAAGIGSAKSFTFGKITINGGEIVAIGGVSAAAIGCGSNGRCGTVTINEGVTSLKAIKSNEGQSFYIGGKPGYYGTITVDGVKVYNCNNPNNNYDHFNSEISTTTNSNDTWTLTHK